MLMLECSPNFCAALRYLAMFVWLLECFSRESNAAPALHRPSGSKPWEAVLGNPSTYLAGKYVRPRRASEENQHGAHCLALPQ